MTYKETCPGCNSHTTCVAHARANGDPCPNCGLSADTATEIMTIRRGQADDAVKATFAELRLRTDLAERQNEALIECLDKIREALNEYDTRPTCRKE